MKLALRLPQGSIEGTISARVIGQVARRAESLGFWGITVNDDLPTLSIDRWRRYPNMGVSLENDRPDLKHFDYFDPLSTLAYVAALTRHVKLIPCVLVVPFFHPVRLARWVASLDRFSQGRLILGVGIGAPGTNYDSKYRSLSNPSGPDMGDPKTRGRVTDEFLRAMIRLWTEDKVSFRGQYCEFEEIECWPKCCQAPHVPIWIGGGKKRACARAAEFGEGMIPHLVSPIDVTNLTRTVRCIALGRGRSINDFKVFCETWACIGNTREEAWAIANPEMVRKSMNQQAPVQPDDSRVLIGTEQDITKVLESFEAAGAYGFELRVIYRSIDHLQEQAKRFAEIQKSFT